MRGVKDSLITFSAVGAAGLLAYYSLSNPSVDSNVRSLEKRSYDDFSSDMDGAADMLMDFNLDGASSDVFMFADGDERRGGRKRGKKKADDGGDSASADKGAEAAAWASSADGKAAIGKKMAVAAAQLKRVNNQYPPASLASLNPDAMDISIGSMEMSSTTSDVIAALAASDNSANCGYGSPGRISSTHVYALFPEDIMYSEDANQDSLYNGYVDFANAMAGHAGATASMNVGTYSYNNLVDVNAYQAGWFADWTRLNVPAKMNRQGTYNLGVATPNVGKILANTWKKVQKGVKRATDTTPGSTSCQVFLFMHNLPYEYKTMASGSFEVPSNLASRCNVVPISIGDSNTSDSFANMAARWNGATNQEYSVVEPMLRGYVNTNADEFANNAAHMADALTTYSCLAENRVGCLCKKDAWFDSEDGFRTATTGAPFTTATTTTEGTTTMATSATSTSDFTTSEFTTTESIAPQPACCGANGGVGMDSVAYDANSQGCCEEDGVWAPC